MNRLLGCLLCIGMSTLGMAQAPKEKIYNGREYFIPPILVSGTPFYKNSDQSANNSVRFDQVLYTGMNLMYDIRNDQLITTRPGDISNMVVVRELVDYFTIGKDTIVYHDDDKSGLAKGFYLRIFDSPEYKGLARYRKVLKDPRQVNERRYFIESVEYFVLTPASPQFVPLRNSRALLSLNKQYKKPLRKVLQTQGNRSDLAGNIAVALQYLTQVPSQ